MKPTLSENDFVVRPYRGDDEQQVLKLLEVALGPGPAGRRPPEFFRWKHFDNPFGRSFMLVAATRERIVGLRAFMRWRLQSGHRTLHAVRAVDTATDPSFHRRGIFSLLTRAALDTLRGSIDLVFNTPNDKSRPGYLKMGWRLVGELPVAVRLRRPIRFAKGLRSLNDGAAPHGVRPPVEAEPALEALADEDDLTRLLADQGVGDLRLRTPRDATFLRWRYGSASDLDYRAIRHSEGGRLRGLAIFRVRPRGRLWETTIAEVIVERGDHRRGRRLLRDVVAAAPVDHVTFRSPGDATVATAMRRSGFLRAPKGIAFAVNPLRDDLRPDPTDLQSWALSLGDVEVF